MENDEMFRRLRRGGADDVIVAELPATRPGASAWLGIYRLHLDEPGALALVQREGGVTAALDSATPVYRVRRFELADELREQWFGEAQLENAHSCVVVGDEALLAKLDELGVSLAQLEPAWRTSYPL